VTRKEAPSHSFMIDAFAETLNTGKPVYAWCQASAGGWVWDHNPPEHGTVIRIDPPRITTEPQVSAVLP